MNALTRYEALLAAIRDVYDRTDDLTAAIRYCWPEWSTLIGRGRPYRAVDVATDLDVRVSRIYKAQHIIGRETTGPTESVGLAPPDGADARGDNQAPAASRTEAHPERRDEQGRIMRRQGRIWLHLDPHSGRVVHRTSIDL